MLSDNMYQSLQRTENTVDNNNNMEKEEGKDDEEKEETQNGKY